MDKNSAERSAGRIYEEMEKIGTWPPRTRTDLWRGVQKSDFWKSPPSNAQINAVVDQMEIDYGDDIGLSDKEIVKAQDRQESRWFKNSREEADVRRYYGITGTAYQVEKVHGKIMVHKFGWRRWQSLQEMEQRSKALEKANEAKAAKRLFAQRHAATAGSRPVKNPGKRD